MDQLIKQTDKTPIEVLLAVDEQGKVSARNVYSFLELNPAHYSRWCRKNILENEFAEKGDDWDYSSSSTSDSEVFTINGENSKGGRPTQDNKLTPSFAKKLCMASNTTRGEEAMDFLLR